MATSVAAEDNEVCFVLIDGSYQRDDWCVESD